jgi:hypothetical protein
MRKIILVKKVDPESFQPLITVTQKHDDGTFSTLFSQTLEWTPPAKYTKEQLEKIETCNNVLISKNMEPLTEEEIEYMLDPEGVYKRLTEIEKEMSDPETIQRMAGFRVEKKIISLD